MPPDLGNWAPLTPPEAAALLAGLPVPWWVAGGWAIDLFVGRQTRPHADLDLAVLRRDQLAVQHHLHPWDLCAADPPGTLRPWRAGEFLPAGIRDVWCRMGHAEPWAFQLLLTETEGDEWFFRHAPQVRGKVASLGRLTPDGIPYVAPEVPLLYKSRNPEPRDEADFRAARPLLDPQAQTWLVSALRQTHPEGHPWVRVSG